MYWQSMYGNSRLGKVEVSVVHDPWYERNVVSVDEIKIIAEQRQRERPSARNEISKLDDVNVSTRSTSKRSRFRVERNLKWTKIGRGGNSCYTGVVQVCRAMVYGNRGFFIVIFARRNFERCSSCWEWYRKFTLKMYRRWKYNVYSENRIFFFFFREIQDILISMDLVEK